MRKKIPVVRALVLAVTQAGCGGDPIYGEWVGTSFTYASAPTMELPYSGDRNGQTYSLETFFSFQEQDIGSLTFHDVYADGTTIVQDNKEVHIVTGEAISVGRWDILVRDYFGLKLQCTASSSTLMCEGEDEDKASYKFEFAPDPAAKK